MYTFNSRVRYSEINHTGNLTITALTNYFQDCSTFQSEDLNIGIGYLTSKHRAWILNSWQIVIERFPSLGENITIGTWASGFNGLYGNRNFILKDSNNSVCAYANSVWIYMDTEHLRPLKITEDVIALYPQEAPYPMNYENRKIKPPIDSTVKESFPVLPSYIDTNQHVNNGQYIRIAESFLPDDFSLYQMRAEYKSSACLGNILIPKLSQDDSRFTVTLASEDGAVYSIVEFKERKH